MNYVSNQNGKVLKEMLADSAKTILRCLCYFKMNLPPSFASSSKFSPIHCHLLHTIKSITNGYVGYGLTFKLVGCQIRALG